MKQQVNERIATSERLARDLEALKDPTLAKMIRLAREGHYDEFKSELIRPIPQLVSDLQAHGYEGMAKRAVNKHYEAEIWEADNWMNTDEAREIVEGILDL